MWRRDETIVLFDVDGTLTRSRCLIAENMILILKKLKKKVSIGFVGGSDLSKQKEQLQDLAVGFFDFSFPENGLKAYKGDSLIEESSFIKHIGEEKYKELVNFTLKYFSELDLPIKRGTFVEFRSGMINVSPIGRSCSYEERILFNELDKKEKIRERLVEAYKKRFDGYGLRFSIGGQISIDIFPEGWDKTYCLKYLRNDFQKIHFFGDMTHEGGNDYEIFSHPDVTGHSVDSPEDTIRQLKEIFDV